jgi:hypothetical protein
MPHANYRELTAHVKKPDRAPPTVPKIGQEIDLDLTLVIQETDPETNQNRTPMAKIRYFADMKAWKQVPRHEAGMMVFFQAEPALTHKRMVIRSIVPSMTAAYADPI